MSVGTPTAPLRFAYWVPNVSGGLVTSGIEQRTDWNWDYNRETAIAAERLVEYKKLGVDLSLLCFLHVKEEIEQFGQEVLPLVREMEAELPDAQPAALAQA